MPDPSLLEVEHARVQTLAAEVERLREALGEYADHQSWRCEHPPHYYLAGDPPENGDCACGLLGTLKACGVSVEEVSPHP